MAASNSDPEARRSEGEAHEIVLLVAVFAVLFLVGQFDGSASLHEVLTSGRLSCLPILAIGCLIYEYCAA